MVTRCVAIGRYDRPPAEGWRSRLSNMIRCARTLGVAVARVRSRWPAAPPPRGRPRPPTYGVGELKNQQVTMSDGTVLSANVYYPTDTSTRAGGVGLVPGDPHADPVRQGRR